MNEELELSERLQGIIDALTVRSATLIAQMPRAPRMTPELMDELRHWIGVACRGAALEGARNKEETLSALVPAPKVGRANVQELASTRADTRRGNPPPPPPKR